MWSQNSKSNFHYEIIFKNLIEQQERQMKSEMELRRKKEESEMLRQMEADRIAAEKLQAEINSENIKLQEQLEQERRDHELALRLAAENNSSVEDIQVWNTTLFRFLQTNSLQSYKKHIKRRSQAFYSIQKNIGFFIIINNNTL